ncbi:MAG TPA: Gfo/Idh/MocA family oxidoreductase [Thermomicrobiales bacterium]|nr:Gfo/Idh/MocA family oxidoreductase [Thermomicrobiales bacterium]
MASPDTVRLGIIGTGLAVEKLHWPALKRMTDRIRVTTFADIDRDHAEHFVSYSGASMDGFTADYHELLGRDDVDAVLISLPIPLNYTVTKDSLEAGKHVICEKPTGGSAEAMRAFIDLEGQYRDRTILIAENWFYRDDLRFARSLLDEGAIGRMHLMAWRNVSQLIPREGEFSSTPWRWEGDYVGGPQLDAGVHNTAQIRLLCGDVDHVSGEIQDANSTHNGPSDLTMNLHFVSEAIGSYTASYPELAMPEEPNDMRLYGTEGVMSISRGGVRIHRPDGSTECWKVEMPDAGYYNEFLNFHQALTGEAELVGTIAQSVRNMEIIVQGLASAEEGKVMEMASGPIDLSPTAVPLWKPAGADGLFDGLGVTTDHEVTKG